MQGVLSRAQLLLSGWRMRSPHDRDRICQGDLILMTFGSLHLKLKPLCPHWPQAMRKSIGLPGRGQTAFMGAVLVSQMEQRWHPIVFLLGIR